MIMDLSTIPPKVVSVACQADCVLSLTFANGERGLLDMKPYLNLGQFKKLQQPQFFQTARVCFGTVAWGSLDLHPAFVYGKCVVNDDVNEVVT